MNDRYTFCLNDVKSEEMWECTHLLKRMLQTDARARPTATTVLLHPFFWSATKRLSFLAEASDRFEILPRLDNVSPSLVLLEADAENVLGGDWLRIIDRTLLDNLGKFRKYNGASVQDLLRALRNKVCIQCRSQESCSFPWTEASLARPSS